VFLPSLTVSHVLDYRRLYLSFGISMPTREAESIPRIHVLLSVLLLEHKYLSGVTLKGSCDPQRRTIVAIGWCAVPGEKADRLGDIVSWLRYAVMKKEKSAQVLGD
jgi:hypothetical protein